ncbi:MAG: putative toxin-antitoxin system toxin component, PIN family [Solirubrobacteraceae bacterium]
MRRYLSLDEAVRFVTDLGSQTTHVADAPTPHPAVCRDPHDDYLVALAVATRADAIVTGDRDLLEPTGAADRRADASRARRAPCHSAMNSSRRPCYIGAIGSTARDSETNRPAALDVRPIDRLTLEHLGRTVSVNHVRVNNVVVAALLHRRGPWCSSASGSSANHRDPSATSTPSPATRLWPQSSEASGPSLGAPRPA